MIRIHKLLSKEFPELCEPILVESPFTQVTVNGIGIRQYHIALTPSKILFACDDFGLVDMENYGQCQLTPPEIETLTLVSLMPLKELKLHCFCYNGRQIMRIHKTSDEDTATFYEIGGHIFKGFVWSTFREKISCLHLMSMEYKPIGEFQEMQCAQ